MPFETHRLIPTREKEIEVLLEIPLRQYAVTATAPGARFSKVPKLFRRISGYIILFVYSKRRRLEARNFAFILIFIPFSSYEKIGFPALAGRSFTYGFSGPKSFQDFRETGPRAPSTNGSNYRRSQKLWFRPDFQPLEKKLKKKSNTTVKWQRNTRRREMSHTIYISFWCGVSTTVMYSAMQSWYCFDWSWSRCKHAAWRHCRRFVRVFSLFRL